MEPTTIILIILAAIAVASLVGLLIAKPKRKNPYSSSSVDISKLTEIAGTRPSSASSSTPGAIKSSSTTRSSASVNTLGGPGEVAGGSRTVTPVSVGTTRGYGSGFSGSTPRVDREKPVSAGVSRAAADTSDRSEAIYSFLRSDGLVHCPSCGVEHRKGSTVCVVCGQKL